MHNEQELPRKMHAKKININILSVPFPMHNEVILSDQPHSVNGKEKNDEKIERKRVVPLT